MSIWGKKYPHVNTINLHEFTTCQSQAGYGAHLRFLKHRMLVSNEEDINASWSVLRRRTYHLSVIGGAS